MAFSLLLLAVSIVFREDPPSGCSTDVLLASLHVNGFYEKKAGCLSYPIENECSVFSRSPVPNGCFTSKAEGDFLHLLLGRSASHPGLADHLESHLPSLLLSCILDC